jgi:hypothetical protein
VAPSGAMAILGISLVSGNKNASGSRAIGSGGTTGGGGIVASMSM